MNKEGSREMRKAEILWLAKTTKAFIEKGEIEILDEVADAL